MAVKNTHYLDVDIKLKNYISLPRVTRNDDVFFIVRITDDGRPVFLTDVQHMVLASLRPDKQTINTVGTKTGDNEITFKIEKASLTFEGRVSAAVQLHYSTERVSTIPFFYEVLPDNSAEFIPSESETSLIQLVLGDAPFIIEAAQTATISAEDAAAQTFEALDNFDTEKSVAIQELDDVKEDNRVTWKAPVANVTARDAAYPNPQNGDTVRLTELARVDRFNGTEWVTTDTDNPAAIDEVTRKLADMSVNVKSFGAVGDYNETTLVGTDNAAAFEAAIAEANKNHSELLIPIGIYYISKDVVFPRNVRCMGTIRGGKVVFSRTRDINVHNLSCDNVDFSGVWRGNINIRGAKKVTVDGSIDWMGSVWNQFSIKVIEELEINISNGFVNQNQFTGGRIGKLRITGTSTKYPTVCEAHNNWFTNVDISSGGAVQDDAKMQTNYLINCYSEAANGGSLIIGNWQVLGNTGDRTPNVNVNSHILFSNDANPKSGQDYISMTTGNMVEGGEWDSLDVKGRPKGVTYTNANADVVPDLTAPDGSGKSVKVQSGLAYASFNFNFKPIVSGKGGITFYLKGELATIELKTSTGSLIYNTWTFVTLPNGWKLYRVNITSDNVIGATFYLNTAQASAKEVFFAGIKATPYKATPLPYYNSSLYCRGSLPSVPTTGIWRKGEFVTNNNISASPGVAMWLCVNDSPLVFSAVPIAT